MYIVFLLFSLSSVYCYGDKSNPYIGNVVGPLVETSSGSVLGKYVKVSDTNIAAFLGIPYAEPPVKEKRFLKPCPLYHWQGILNATVKPKPCMQFSSRNFSWIPTSTPSEDCLYLNVWTPTSCCGSEERLPVIVWIYGGGFYSGSSDIGLYDGSILASSNRAVIVSINYRVGIFGFLYSGSNEAPGNVGLHDQNLALKWIKKNIGSFGGDPNRITVMGESAGSWSVSLHLISPMSKNLFNAAIMESGAAFHPQIVDPAEIAFLKANAFAKIIGCLVGNSSIETDPEVMECIKSKSSMELAKTEDTFTSKLPQYFLPVFGEEFLPSSPIKTISEGNIAPVPILIGTTQNEATIFLNYVLPDLFKPFSEPLVTGDAAKQILGGLFSTVPNPSSDEIYDYYFKNSADAKPRQVAQIIADAFGDYVFNCPTQFFAEKSRNSYFYWMSHRSVNEPLDEWLGVPHTSEIQYVFGIPLQYRLNYSNEDINFSLDLLNKWLTFAEKGYPLADTMSAQRWPLFTAEEPVAYELNPRKEGTIKYPRADACEFWRPFLSPEFY